MTFQKDTFRCGVFQGISCGEGTILSPFLISTFSDLESIGDEDRPLNAYYKVINDILMTPTQSPLYNEGLGWEPIGDLSTPFTGQFDGDNHTISGLFIDRNSDLIGLFGKVEGVIKNLKLTNGNVGGKDKVGGVCGESTGILSCCYYEGTIFGENYLGGVCGNLNGAVIDKSFSTGDVFGTSNIGGLVGKATNSDVTDSYSEADTSGTSGVGGLVGVVDITNIINCYSIGLVSGTTDYGGLVGSETDSTATYSYWNTQTSNQANSPLGVGRTTDEMKNPDNYTGWDFDTIWESTEIALAKLLGAEIIPSGGAKTLQPEGEAFSYGEATIAPMGTTIEAAIGNIVASGLLPTVTLGTKINPPVGEANLLGMPIRFPSELDVLLYDLTPYQISKKFIHYISFKLEVPDREPFTIIEIEGYLNNEPIPINVLTNGENVNRCELVIDTNHLKDGWKKLDISVVTNQNSNQFRRYLKIM